MILIILFAFLDNLLETNIYIIKGNTPGRLLKNKTHIYGRITKTAKGNGGSEGWITKGIISFEKRWIII